MIVGQQFFHIKKKQPKKFMGYAMKDTVDKAIENFISKSLFINALYYVKK